jgi:hypothetical protein
VGKAASVTDDQQQHLVTKENDTNAGEITPISEIEMTKMQERPIPSEKPLMISGFVFLDNSTHAIAIDSRMISNYPRRDVKIYVNAAFFCSLVLSLFTGIVIWINGHYALDRP